MATAILYAYDIEMVYRNGSTETKLEPQSIKMIAIDFDYYFSNMPSIYITMNLKLNTFNDMVLNSKSGKIYLKLSKYNKNDSLSISKKHIESLFDYYFTSSDIEYDEDHIKTTKSEDTSYRNVVMGLIDNRLVAKNKISINGVLNGCNLTTTINYYAKGMKLVIEPFKRNPTVSNFIIPPIDSLSKLVAYLDEYFSLYDSDYIYFLDFNATYLISTNGRAISLNDSTYDTIKIDINATDIDDPSSVIQGVVEDPVQKVYIMKVGASNTSISINKIMEKRFTKILGITTDGTINTQSLAIDKNDDTSEKTKVVRSNSNNYANVLKSQIDSSNTILSITKADVDMGIIVPYKEFYIDNVGQYKYYNGRYGLISKKEIYTNGDGGFYCSSIMNFKKIN